MTLRPPEPHGATELEGEVLETVAQLHGAVVCSPRTGAAIQLIERFAAELPRSERRQASVLAELYTALLFAPPANPLAFVHRILDSQLARAALLDPPAALGRLAAFDPGAGELLQRGAPESEVFVALMQALFRSLRVAVPPSSLLLQSIVADPPGRRMEGLAIAAPSLAAPTSALDARLLDAVASAPPTVVAVASQLVAAGGKRIRPQLVRALATSPDDPWVWQAATTVEWLHQVSLVVDDIVDGAQLRRGRPCLHHTIGAPAALAVCDALLRAVAADLPADLRREAAVAGVDLARGELLESVLPATSRETYLDIVRAKTGSLFRFAGWAGYAASGLDPDDGAAFGEALGVAFQVIDDALDLTADPHDTGKDACQDVASDRFTLPRQLLEHRLSPADRQLAVEERTAAWYAERMQSTGALAACQSFARAQLDGCTPPAGTPELEALVTAVLERDR